MINEKYWNTKIEGFNYEVEKVKEKEHRGNEVWLLRSRGVVVYLGKGRYE